jgi:hypothetical protein
MLNTGMLYRRLFKIIPGVLLCSVSFIGVQAQVLKDTATFNIMRQGVGYIYNLQFDKAMEMYDKIRKKYPEHPMTYVYKGMMVYWQGYPLVSTSPSRAAFEDAMLKAVELCEKKHSKDADAEFILAGIGARGLLLMFYADNELSMDVIQLASGTYYYVKRSFEFTSIYPDFYFVTGLYNYYREAYPEAHPVYKPLALLFPKGDKIKGLKELQIAAHDGIILKAEASSFLSGICISFENNFQQAYLYSKSLHELFPENPQYLATYIKNLLLLKRYDESELVIKSSRLKFQNAYIQAQFSIFNGILYEKKYHDLKAASDYYLKGIKDARPYGEFAYEYVAYAYFGLSRISNLNNDKPKSKAYRKKAEEMADYKNINFDN